MVSVQDLYMLVVTLVFYCYTGHVIAGEVYTFKLVPYPSNQCPSRCESQCEKFISNTQCAYVTSSMSEYLETDDGDGQGDFCYLPKCPTAIEGLNKLPSRLKIGHPCEADGSMGTNNLLNNCHYIYDVYHIEYTVKPKIIKIEPRYKLVPVSKEDCPKSCSELCETIISDNSCTYQTIDDGFTETSIVFDDFENGISTVQSKGDCLQEKCPTNDEGLMVLPAHSYLGVPCEADGHLGTNDKLNNCEIFDIYHLELNEKFADYKPPTKNKNVPRYKLVPVPKSECPKECDIECDEKIDVNTCTTIDSSDTYTDPIYDENISNQNSNLKDCTLPKCPTDNEGLNKLPTRLKLHKFCEADGFLKTDNNLSNCHMIFDVYRIEYTTDDDILLGNAYNVNDVEVLLGTEKHKLNSKDNSPQKVSNANETHTNFNYQLGFIIVSVALIITIILLIGFVYSKKRNNVSNLVDILMIEE